MVSLGLSPHGRGNPAPTRRWTCCLRSIPARAGEPAGRSAGAGGSWVYPRTGGGTKPQKPFPPRGLGLSPHGRGNLGVQLVQSDDEGSIPARAGEPRIRPHPRGANGVYPRTGGGTARWTGWVYPRTGGGSGGGGWSRAVYPRTGGGTAGLLQPHGSGSKGLSPHGRGNPAAAGSIPARAGVGRIRGSIPARAGEPLPSNRLIMLNC